MIKWEFFKVNRLLLLLWLYYYGFVRNVIWIVLKGF